MVKHIRSHNLKLNDLQLISLDIRIGKNIIRPQKTQDDGIFQQTPMHGLNLQVIPHRLCAAANLLVLYCESRNQISKYKFVHRKDNMSFQPEKNH